MNIRIAVDENDSKSASYIYAMSWKSGYKGIFSDALLNDLPLDFWVKYFNGNYQTHRFEIAIINDDEKDVGAGGYGLSRNYDDPCWGEITSIYFLEEVWGKGYSKTLMDFMINKLKETGCTKIHIWVLKDNIRAQRFYRKNGFKKTGNENTIEIKGESKIDVEYALEV